MEIKKTLSKYLPYLVAIGIFLIINLLYFAPQFSGQVLYQHDIMQYDGMTQDIIEHREAYGEDPQWAGNMFSGMPSYLINISYEGTPIRHLAKAFYFCCQPANLIFFAMLGFFFMLLCLGISPWIALICGLGYGFSSYFYEIIAAGHITKMMALSAAPTMMGGIFYAFRKNMWLGACITAFFGSVLIGVNHPQISYYFFLIILAYWINEFIKAYKAKTMARFAKVSGLLVLAGALALGTNAGMLYHIQSHSQETMRGGSELAAETEKDKGLDLDYATAWSYGKAETLNLLIPNLYGGSSEGGFKADGEVAQSLDPYNARGMATQLPAYWGNQPITSGPVYIGAVMIFLAVLGMFLLRGTNKWWLAGITLLAILLSWGKNFMGFTELFFNIFPLYNKFRTVSMILVIVEWTIPLLAALTLQQIAMRDFSGEKLFKALKYTIYIVGGTCLFFLLLGSTVMSFHNPFDDQFPQDVAAAMRSERASLLRMDALRSLAFVLLTATACGLFVYEKLKRRGLFIILAMLVCFDMVPVNLRYLNADRFVDKRQGTILPTEADKLILEDKEIGFRVMNFAVSPFQDATTSYFHRSIGGYHGAKLSRYQDLIERHLSQMNMQVYNMLNTKYFISRDQESGQLYVQENPDRNGAAWFVRNIEEVDGAAMEIEALNGIDTKTTAVIDRKFASDYAGLTLQTDSTASIKLEDYRVNHLTYRYESAVPALAVFSEIYYPKGWTAYIDGIETPYFRADYVLRALVLPAGEYTVEFKFRAPHYRELNTLTLICSLIILGGLAASIIIPVVKKKKNGRQQQED